MRIQAAETFATRGLNIEEITALCREKLPPFTDGDVDIDFSRCVLDYPATSLISDAVFERINDAPKPRRINFVFDIDFAERVFLKSFFFGSTRLKLENEKVTVEEIKTNLTAVLAELDASLTISIIDPEAPSNTTIRTFAYGQQRTS